MVQKKVKNARQGPTYYVSMNQQREDPACYVAVEDTLPSIEHVSAQGKIERNTCI